MKLKTDRLLLRSVEAADVNEVARMWNYPAGRISRGEARKAIAGMEENTEKNRPGRIYHLCLAVCEKENAEKIIGWCGLDGLAEPGKTVLFYVIEEEYRSRGYATQCAARLLQYAFEEMACEEIHGACHKENAASRTVMRRAGMTGRGLNEAGDPVFSIRREAYLAQREGIDAVTAPADFGPYLDQTPLLDYSSPAVEALVLRKGWRGLPPREAIRGAYGFVRDEIPFGYNRTDAIPASQVLADGYGQCNTKGILFMALLRALGIPCRMHGFTINKALQKGAMTGLIYRLAPARIVHSWVEVYYGGQWFELEGFILDKAYLSRLQKKFRDCPGSFCGYGAAVDDLQNPPIDWDENNTYIQSKGIVDDFGVFLSPDEFFASHSQPLSRVKEWLFEHYGRRRMNRAIRRIRDAKKAK